MKRALLLFGVLVVWLGWPSDLDAQSRPYGCSLGLPQVVEAGLDDAVAGACTRHDQCWSTAVPQTSGQG